VPIDGCTHSFQHLANVVLPAHMERMREALAKPIPMATFAAEKHGPKTCARHLGLARDFSGVYVLVEKGTPIYVGISRGVLGRLIQHCRGRTHYDASLAYLIAKKKQPHSTHRAKAMVEPAFLAAFNEAQGFLRSLDVAFVEITCPVELALFEMYAALELRTAEWNSFRTH
jgi:hypothetical protein